MPTYKVVTEIKLMVEAADAFEAAQAVAVRLRGLNTSTCTQNLNMTVQPVIPELVPGEDADEPDEPAVSWTGHYNPHFNASGSCICNCRRCTSSSSVGQCICLGCHADYHDHGPQHA